MFNRYKEVAIKPDEYNIRERYIYFNRKYFSGKLPEDLPLRFSSLASRKVMGMFQFIPRPTGTVQPESCSITLDSAFDYTEAGYDGVLLHEMVHAYLIMILNDQDMTSGGHHPRFWDLLNHIDSLARADGIDMPPTESGSMRDFAKGRTRRQSMCLGLFRIKDDPEGLLRFSPMLPGVFDSIVNDFKFKLKTKTGAENDFSIGRGRKAPSTTTDLHPGAWFYSSVVPNSQWYSTIDWDYGFKLYKIEGAELPFYLEGNFGVKLTQRFFGKTNWVTELPDLYVRGTKVFYSPEMIGVINRAIARAIGVATVKKDGVYVNRSLIHAAPTPADNPVEPNTKRIGAEILKTTSLGMVLDVMVDQNKLPANFRSNTDPNAVYTGIILRNGTSQLMYGEFEHGETTEDVCLFVLNREDPYSRARYDNLKTACAFFNMLPDSIRSKIAWATARETLLLVNKNQNGVYSGIRFTQLANALETALSVPKDSILGAAGNMLGDVDPGLLWGYFRKACRAASPERLEAVYKALNASPYSEMRTGGVPLTRIDADSFMEDVFGCGNANVKFPMHFALATYCSMLANTEPYKVLISKTMEANPTAAFHGALDYFGKLTDKLTAITINNADYARIDEVAAAIQREFQASFTEPMAYRANSERDLSTKEKLRDNFVKGGGVFLHSRFDTVSKALLKVKQSGTQPQKSLAEDALLTLTTIEWYCTRVPDTNGVDKEHIDVRDMFDDLENCVHIIDLFKDPKDIFLVNDSLGSPSMRAISLGLFLFGDLQDQMPTVYRDGAKDIWLAIEDTVTGGEYSILKSAIKSEKVIPDLVAEAGPISGSFGYTTKSYREMDGPEKELVLQDAGFTVSEVREFFAEGYSKRPLSELPELYAKAFGGYKYLSGRGYVIPTRDDVSAAVNPNRLEKLATLSRWETLYSKYSPGDKAINLIGDSKGEPFEYWRQRLILDYQNELLYDRSVINQNDRSMNFPYGEPEPGIPALPAELNELERRFLLEFAKDPEWSIAITKIRSALGVDDLTPTLDKLILRGLVEREDLTMVKLTYEGRNWLANNIPAVPTESSLPPGWTESTPGGLATNKDPVNGGIIDKNIEGWFVIFNDDNLKALDGFANRIEAFSAFFEVLDRRDNTPIPPEQPIRPPPSPASGLPEPDHLNDPPSPERSVKAPKVKEADGKTYFNITIGVNEKTKRLMFVPVETAKSNNIGLVRKREAKPVASFLSYVFAEELDAITKKIKSGNRKSAARDLALIANSVRRYLVDTVNASTPFPNKLAAKVEADFGGGLSGQKAFWRFLQGKATTRKKLYSDVEQLKVLAGITKPKKDVEEASWSSGQFEFAEFIDNSLYGAVSFSEQTVRMLEEWCEANKIPNPVDLESMHATFVHTTNLTRQDWKVKAKLNPPVVVQPKDCKLETWRSPKGRILVLTFKSEWLHSRWKKARDMGASWKFASFIPHVTLSYDIGDNVDISKYRPPMFPLVIEREYTELVRA